MTEIVNNVKLFNNGLPQNFGWALGGVVEYNVEDAKLRPFALKEWNFYQISSPEFCMQITLGHVSYATSINVSVIEFMSGKRLSLGKMLPFKKVELDKNADQDSKITYKDKDLEVLFKTTKNFRQIKVVGFDKEHGKIDIDITMLQNPYKVLVLTPFEREDEFYLNEKLNCMATVGFAKIGNLSYNFDENKTYGLLDWGRGVLPKKHEWIWSSLSDKVNGKPFGFNLGIFGKDDFGTENILYYGEKKQKIGKVKIEFDNTNYMNTWHFVDEEGLLDIYMQPTFDNYTTTKVLFVNNSCHQVFGKWHGKVVIEGEEIEISDLFGFAENAKNCW